MNLGGASEHVPLDQVGPIKGPAGSGGEADLGFGQAGWVLGEMRFGFGVVFG